ncbi:hypothetical protein IL38_23760 [Actinopolyspora erythraea]|uniref:HTH luxR-type domain-containing protein n=1 Tax=Actinopolyspora erythraea TaxID=414996 RepID=A0ABR4WY62_9ACTN|nr:helix-turn-helix transcriptional regulator [Actinopolyspora erythraea]KGI79329.1 hypothetical protein IL38_23760 [Actinopolyspora erythraea]
MTPRARWHPASLQAVTNREYELLQEVAAGRSNREISQRLVCSEASVKSILFRLRAKFHVHGVASRAQLVILAYELGVVAPGWVKRAELSQVEPVGRRWYPYQRSAAERLTTLHETNQEEGH